MIRSTMIFALLVSFASTSWADERTQKTIEARQGLLKVVAQYFGPIVGMAKGQIPYDAELIEKNAGKVAELAPHDYRSVRAGHQRQRLCYRSQG